MTATTIRAGRRSARALALAAGVAVLAALSGCTAPAAPTTTPTVVPAAQQHFVCPSAAQVGGLTAMPFTLTTGAGTCSYSTGSGAGRSSVVISRPAHAGTTSTWTLAAYRGAAPKSAVVEDERRFSFDAFSTARGGTCTLWVYAADGAVVAVAAKRAAVTGSASCALARTTAALVTGTASKTGVAAAPVVSVIGSTGLDRRGGLTDQVATAIAKRPGVRVDRVPAAGSGYIAQPGAAATFLPAARRVAPGSAAVVFVSDASDAAVTRFDLLRAATRAFAAATARAPHAHLIVVGPTADGGTATSDELALRDALHAAAQIGDATWIDPIAADGTTIDGSATGTAARAPAARLATAIGKALE